MCDMGPMSTVTLITLITVGLRAAVGTTAALHLDTDKRVQLGQSSMVTCTSDTDFLPTDFISIKNPGGHSVIQCMTSKQCLLNEQTYYHYKLRSTLVLGINSTVVDHNGTWTCQLNGNSATGLLIVESPAETTSSTPVDPTASAQNAGSSSTGSVHLVLFLVYVLYI